MALSDDLIRDSRNKAAQKVNNIEHFKTQILLTDAEAAMAGVRPYIGQKITPSKDPAKEPKISDDGTGTLRYTANPPEGKNIGDIVFEGVDITGFTQNELQLANSLRDDLTKQIEPFRDIRSSFSQIDGFYEEAQLENSPVSDYSLAVQYAKVIDPGTAAREGEVAAIASSQHLSQGFGRLTDRGSQNEYLEFLKGESLTSEDDIFEGIDISWNRVTGGNAIGTILKTIETNFNFTDPSVHIPDLLEAYKRIQNIDDAYWKSVKTKEIKEVILAYKIKIP